MKHEIIQILSEVMYRAIQYQSALPRTKVNIIRREPMAWPYSADQLSTNQHAKHIKFVVKHVHEHIKFVVEHLSTRLSFSRRLALS